MAETGGESPGGASESLLPPQDRGFWGRMRYRAHDMVEGTIDTTFEYCLLFMIFVNVVALVTSTIVVEPDCIGSECERLGDRYERVFETVEWTSVVIFTAEYLLRVWSCVEFPAVAAKGAFWGRLSHMLTFFPLIDLLAIAPNWASLIPGIDESPDFTTAARIVRLVFIFKADKYVNAFSLLGQVLQENSTLLVATSFYSSLCWVVAATLLFFTERDNLDLGTHFQSIPQAMFPTLLMLTGEYPLADFTPIGQVIAGFIAVVAVAIFAVPTGVLGSGFIQAVQRSSGREFTVDID